MKKSSNFLGVAMVVLAASMWGHTGFFVKHLSRRGVSETGISIMRLFFTFIIMALFILIFDKSLFKISPKCLPYFILTGVIGMVGSSLFYFYAINGTSVAVAAVLMYTAPTIVMLLSLFIFKDKLTWKHIVCCILAFVGSALSCGLFSGNIKYSLMGIVFGCLAGFSYALYSVGSGLALRHGCSPLSISLYSFAFASLTIIIVGAIQGEIPKLIASWTNDWVILPIALAQAVMTCLLPYILYTVGIRFTSPSKASIMSTVELVVASIIGFVSFNEKIAPIGIVGMVLVILSVVVLNVHLGRSKDNTNN